MPSPRTRAAIAACLSAVPASFIGSAVVPEAASARAGGLSGSEVAVLHGVNGVRAQAGLPALSASRALSRAASRQSRRCLRIGALSHAGLQARIRRVTKAKSVGETLAWAPRGGGHAAQVVSMWMNSPPHRAELLSPGFRRIGLGERKGRLGGARGVMVTADLATG